ncbi:hypothetical protein AB5I41_28210 [Sphingomonas sp. MMS24-JH45]
MRDSCLADGAVRADRAAPRARARLRRDRRDDDARRGAARRGRAGPCPGAASVVIGAALALAMLATASALVLSARSSVPTEGRDGRRVLIGALMAMWATGLAIEAGAWIDGGAMEGLSLARGLSLGGVGLFMAVAVHRGGEWTLRPSRDLALRGLGIAAIVATGALVAALSGMLAAIGGTHARMIQTGFVVGTGVAFLTLASTPWLRAWARVMVAEHLFLGAAGLRRA